MPCIAGGGSVAPVRASAGSGGSIAAECVKCVVSVAGGRANGGGIGAAGASVGSVGGGRSVSDGTSGNGSVGSGSISGSADGGGCVDGESVVGGGGGGGRALLTVALKLRLARFRDGTTIRRDPTRGHVLVEAPAFASAALDLAVDRASRRHARGLKVPVACGGERARVRLALPDGTSVVASYNTRVTSETRGKLSIVRPDRTEVRQDDGGMVGVGVEWCGVVVIGAVHVLSRSLVAVP